MAGSTFRVADARDEGGADGAPGSPTDVISLSRRSQRSEEPALVSYVRLMHGGMPGPAATGRRPPRARAEGESDLTIN